MVSDNLKVRFACAKGLEPTRDPLCMRKELIYEGRHTDGNNKQFTVTKDTIRYWVKAFNEINAAGMEIPAPVSAVNAEGLHPETQKTADKNAAGTWLTFQEGVRPDGLACINATVKFKDEHTRDALKNSDVSIFAENNYTGPNGKTYSTCITHAMFTDNPAIEGLSGFIACSRIEGTETMTILEFAQSIELVGEEATEEEAIDALKSALVKKADADKEEATEAAEPEEDEEEEDKDKVEASAVAPSVVKAVAASRRTAIENLQLKRQLDPKTAKELLTEYGSDKRIRADLKAGSEEFEKVCIACSRLPVNESLPVPGSSGTKSQIAASKGGADSPTVADAKRRAKEAQANRRR